MRSYYRSLMEVATAAAQAAGMTMKGCKRPAYPESIKPTQANDTYDVVGYMQADAYRNGTVEGAVTRRHWPVGVVYAVDACFNTWLPGKVVRVKGTYNSLTGTVKLTP